ncbi:ribonuclease Z [Bacillus mesophilus]|uniref:Ribonuclease Z n=1 Tax=Bacillus mesophilus TaxID=1808955 RepID=A0A6M0Q904_9BACI|nr:ribonuclease Z [Bacillus mesophilus]MBM7660960.1 ribonuclease Z [Bacillus mesophilus]NEY71498.1 ribonuclease Z [Bacillus mesophilus]
MELVFLGTGAGIPAKERNVSSIALQLLEERSETWLFDCGEATQHQILHTSIRPRRIEKIFITHLHGDHIFGLPGLLGSRSFQGGETPLTIYGPTGLKEFVEVTMRVSRTHLRYPVNVVEVTNGTIFEDDQFRVEASLLAHGIPSYGYRIIEKDLPGTLLVDKLKQEGISPGPHFKKLKLGEIVNLSDGRVIDGKDYIGVPIPGRIITILGDTRFTEQSVTLANNADVLVHEATFSHEEAQLAHEYFHSSTVQAANIAKQANVEKLLLTHISSRYQKEDTLQLLEEAKQVFTNVEIAHDFSTYRVQRRGKNNS